MSRFPLMALLLAAALAMPLAGCKKDNSASAAAADAATLPVAGGAQPGSAPAGEQTANPMAPVSDAQRQRAAEAVRQAYAQAQAATPTPADASAQYKTLLADLAVLTRNPHRLAGFDNGSRAASAFVENRLKAMGIKTVISQEFPLVSPVTTQCRLLVDGKEIAPPAGQPRAIYAMRPNLLQGCVTPEGGLSGQAFYAGRGSVEEYHSTLVKDRIVVLDFDSGKNWLNAFAFGARAVVFVGSESEVATNAYHHLNMPANLPRFYVQRELAKGLGLLDNSAPRQVTIDAACEWRPLRGRNVIAFIPGSGPKFSDTGLPHTIVLAAPLDSLSEVPELSPGARDGANCGLLLQMAASLAANPPRRNTLICFFDGQALNHAGARAFYGAINREKSNVTAARLEDLQKVYTSERAFLRDVMKVFGTGDVFGSAARQAVSPKVHRQAIEILRTEALNEGGDVLEELRPLRLQRNSLSRTHEGLVKELAAVRQNGAPDGGKVRELETRLGQLASQIQSLDGAIDRLSVRDVSWNGVQRDLHEQVITGESRARFEELLGIVNREYGQRLVELEQSIADTSLALRLRDALGPQANQILLHLSINFGDAREKWTFIHGDDSGNAVTIAHAETGGQGDDKASLYGNLFSILQGVWQDLGDDVQRGLKGLSYPVDRDRILQFAAARSLGAAATERLAKLTPREYRSIDDISAQLGLTSTVPLFDRKPLDRPENNRLYAPGLFVDSGAIARIFAVFNLSTMTVMDPLPRQGQPCDTVAALRPDRMAAAAGEALTMIRRLADNPAMEVSESLAATAGYIDPEWSDTTLRLSGSAVRTLGGGSAMRQRPVRGAVVAMFHVNSSQGTWKDMSIELVPPGFDVPVMARSNLHGIYQMGPYGKNYFLNAPVLAATFDQTRGPDGVTRSRGVISSITCKQNLSPADLTKAVILTFDSRIATVVDNGFDRGGIASLPMRAMSTAPFRADGHLLCEHENVLTLFAPIDAAGFKLFNKSGWVLLNNSLSEPEGQGISLADPFEHPVTALRTALDLNTLDESRLDLLARNRINQDSLQEIQERAKELTSGAHDGRLAAPATMPASQPAAAATTAKYFGDLQASAALSRRVYNPLVGVMNDLVTAVVLLLLLAIPFAFALERLIIGSPHIYRQIGCFGVFFLATFGLLFLVNPAFRIAATPIIIFLAFAIILLSSLVIFIMVRKLQAEIGKMQGLATSVHNTDVSRLSTMMAAVNMGISTMRRRPLRTLLTSATVVLLTFTILTFASFGSSWGIRRTHVGPMTGSVPRILVRHQLWSPIGPGVVQTLRGHLSTQARVIPRYWVSPTAQEAADAVITNANTDLLVSDANVDRTTTVAAAVGLDPADVELLRGPTGRGEIERLLDGDTSLLASDGIFLTAIHAKLLGLSTGDVGKARLMLAGRWFTFAGTIREEAASYNILEGSSILPVDYAASAGTTGLATFATEGAGRTASEVPDRPNAQFVPFSIDRIVIIPAAKAADMRGRVRSVNIYPNNPAQLQAIADRAAAVSELPTYVGDAAGVYRLIFTSLTEASGLRDLLIPVLLGGLIVFATMLGSVSDREREIYTFSSLGLAPPHIASLFFAEASMYAVIGGMGGYLLGQVVARLLAWLGGVLDFTVPTMNYSSTNAIVTVLIVMSTVLISTIYPAMKASRSANPGIQRAWKIPNPKADLYDLVFPFTVSAYDIIGVVSFLKEHFDNYSDTSLGVFTTSESHIFRQKGNDMLGFAAQVALAPFDLGVNQGFALLSQPSDIEGIDEVRILIRRLTGAPGDWQRANRLFVDDLRKQLLIWRSLPNETMDLYRQKTLELWGCLPQEQVDPQSMNASMALSLGGAR